MPGWALAHLVNVTWHGLNQSHPHIVWSVKLFFKIQKGSSRTRALNDIGVEKFWDLQPTTFPWTHSKVSNRIQPLLKREQLNWYRLSFDKFIQLISYRFKQWVYSKNAKHLVQDTEVSEWVSSFLQAHTKPFHATVTPTVPDYICKARV